MVNVRYETVVPAALEETFAFFADARNLERLTPRWLHFGTVTPMPVAMREGLEIEYRLAWHWLPIRWISRIELWEPSVRFIDRQIVGPYRWWRHEHRFEAAAAGTRVIDEVEFVPRLPRISRRLVRSDVERIFTYRRAMLGELFTRAS